MAQEIEFTDTFLNDQEKAALNSIADSELMVNALKKVVLADVYFRGVFRPGIAPEPARNSALLVAIGCVQGQGVRTNEELGAETRAFAEAVVLVESGFSRLDKFKSVNKGKPEKKNPGR